MDSPSQCFLIDDILTLFVELNYIPYGVSKFINSMIHQRDIRAGLDESASKCCRMIEFAKDYAKKHGEEPNACYSRIYLNCKTPEIANILETKYGFDRYYFLYLAYKIVVFDWMKTNTPNERNMYKIITKVDGLMSYGGESLRYNGRPNPGDRIQRTLRCNITIKVFNMLMAMIGESERYYVSNNNHRWECEICGQCNTTCTCLQDVVGYKKISYIYKYRFELSRHDNNIFNLGDENIVPYGEYESERINWFTTY